MFLRLVERIVKERLLQNKITWLSVFVIGKDFFPSFQLENKSFVLKDLSIDFKHCSCFMPDLVVLIYQIHSAVPLLFMLFESEIVLISLR